MLKMLVLKNNGTVWLSEWGLPHPNLDLSNPSNQWHPFVQMEGLDNVIDIVDLYLVGQDGMVYLTMPAVWETKEQDKQRYVPGKKCKWKLIQMYE